MKKITLKIFLIFMILAIIVQIPFYAYAKQTIEEEAESVYKIFKWAHENDIDIEDGITADNNVLYDYNEAKKVIKKAIDEGNLDEATKEMYKEFYTTSKKEGGLGGKSTTFESDEVKKIEDTYKEALDGAKEEDAKKYLQDQVDQGKIDQEMADNIEKEAKDQQGTLKDDNEHNVSGTVVMGDTSTQYKENTTDPIENPDSYKPEGTSEDAERLKEIGQVVISALRVVGIVIAVVVLLSLGIKYMIAGASDKAEYKKSMIPFLIGAFVLLAGTQLVGIIYDLMVNANNIQ